MCSFINIPIMSYFISIFILFVSSMATVSSQPLLIGFYQYSCPSAEVIVNQTVHNAISANPGIGAGLIRMHFHDCFIRGCDASVLLESTPGNKSEREHPANNPSLRGFEVINEAKAGIEAQCPNTVSCADIIAFAARDSSYHLGNIYYGVPSGRRDGIESHSREVNGNIPFFTLNADQLAQSFANKGLSVDEMVTLSGAHSIGIAHCSSFINRLYNFSKNHDVDPSLDPEYAAFLRAKCPPDATAKVALDQVSPNRLDNMYYADLLRSRGLLSSDQALMNNTVTKGMVSWNARFGKEWADKYAMAMVQMGSIGVLTGSQGQIRTHCSFVNE